MAPASNTTSSAQRINNPLIKEEWKHNVWKQSTVVQLLTKDKTIIELKSKEKSNPKICSVHKALLCFYSPYHDRLFNGEFVEGLAAPTKPLTINTGASILKLFLTWLYTGKLGIAPPTSEEFDNQRWFLGITKLYLLADELNCIALKLSIISAQVAVSKDISLARYDIIELLSNSSLEYSRLYQYFLEAFSAHWHGHSSDGSYIDPRSALEDPMPPNFAYRLLVEKTNGTKQHSGSCTCCYDPCKFHGHINEAEREATCGTMDGDLDILDIDCDFDTRSESESETATEQEPALRNESAVKKRSREDGGAAGSKTKHAKMT